VLVLQREIPEEASLHAARIASAAGVRIIYNPAPAPSGGVNIELLCLADLVIPNEVEASMLSGQAIADIPDAVAAARKMLQQGAKVVVITLGARGVVWVQEGKALHYPAFPVNPVDTTGAGDAFIGTLAARLALGETMEAALRWASAAGALATTRLGALPSMPTTDEVTEFLAQRSDFKPVLLTGWILHGAVKLRFRS
jgi:ribokinase